MKSSTSLCPPGHAPQAIIDMSKEIPEPKRGLLHTLVFIFIIQAVPSAIISGGIEFAVAYGMYHGVKEKITLWRFPHTMSGDCALTVFIQVCVTWVAEELFIGWDDYLGTCGHIPWPWKIPQNKWVRLFFEVDRGMRRMYTEWLDWSQEAAVVLDDEKNGPPGTVTPQHTSQMVAHPIQQEPNDESTANDSENPDEHRNKEDKMSFEDTSSKDHLNPQTGFKPLTFKEYLLKQFIHYDNHGFMWNFIEWAIQKVIRGLILSAIIWFFVWPVTMGILAGIGTKIGSHEYYFNHYPFPQVMKMIYGVVIGLISTPATIIVIMLRNDWHEADYQERELRKDLENEADTSKSDEE